MEEQLSIRQELRPPGAVAPDGPPATHSTRTEALCRVIDLLVAGLALMLLSPLLALVAIAIRLDSRGPALFRQDRIGRGLKPFRVVKFRTMQHGADDSPHRTYVLELIAGVTPEGNGSGPRFKLVGDPRVTRLGHFLRRSSLDELPQLWNVVRGEMSLVGPRPPIPYEVERYPAHWFARFAVKPGVTGLWQVSGRSELSLEEMIALDLEYIRRRSPWFNLRILLRTLPVVLSCRGAS